MNRSSDRTAVRGREIQRMYSPQSSTYIFQRGDFTGGPIFYAESVDVTPELASGGVVDVGITILNGRRTVTPLNPAYCDTGGFVSPDGLGARIEVQPSWTNGDSTSVCVPPAGISPSREDILFDYEAPTEAGTYYVDVTITEDTGNRDADGGTERFEVVVLEEGGEKRPGEGDRGGRVDDGDGGGGDNSLLGTEQVIALAAFSILIVVALGVTR